MIQKTRLKAAIIWLEVLTSDELHIASFCVVSIFQEITSSCNMHLLIRQVFPKISILWLSKTHWPQVDEATMRECDKLQAGGNVTAMVGPHWTSNTNSAWILAVFWLTRGFSAKTRWWRLRTGARCFRLHKVVSVFVSFQPQGADSLRDACYPSSVTGASAGMTNWRLWCRFLHLKMDTDS